jgi:ABC-type polysaccharide/polyol phosphate export permease
MDIPAATAYEGGVSRQRPLARVLAYRDCLSVLTLRSIRVRYRRSVLGFGWSLLYPLTAMLVLTAVFSQIFTGLEFYPLYAIVGVLAWGFFSLACVQSMDALLGGASIMRKVYVPASVFPLAAVAANFVNLLLSISLLPLIMWMLGASPGLQLGWLLVGLFLLLCFTTGLALALSALNLFFHDVRYFFDAGLLIWFYATPIVYPAEVIPQKYAALLWFNPLHWLIAVLRAPLYEGVGPDLVTLCAATLASTVSLVLGWRLFSRLEQRFHLYL